MVSSVACKCAMHMIRVNESDRCLNRLIVVVRKFFIVGLFGSILVSIKHPTKTKPSTVVFRSPNVNSANQMVFLGYEFETNRPGYNPTLRCTMVKRSRSARFGSWKCYVSQ